MCEVTIVHVLFLQASDCSIQDGLSLSVVFSTKTCTQGVVNAAREYRLPKVRNVVAGIDDSID
jgi:hypothetical protein